MIMVYVTLIIKGTKTYKDVPDTLKQEVAQMLTEVDCAHLAE